MNRRTSDYALGSDMMLHYPLVRGNYRTINGDVGSQWLSRKRRNKESSLSLQDQVYTSEDETTLIDHSPKSTSNKQSGSFRIKDILRGFANHQVSDDCASVNSDCTLPSPTDSKTFSPRDKLCSNSEGEMDNAPQGELDMPRCQKRVQHNKNHTGSTLRFGVNTILSSATEGSFRSLKQGQSKLF